MVFFGCCGNAPRHKKQRAVSSAKGALVWFPAKQNAPGDDPAAMTSPSPAAEPSAEATTGAPPSERDISAPTGPISGADRRPIQRRSSPMIAARADRSRSRKMGEIQRDNIKSVRELARLMQSRDEETRRKNKDLTVKNSAASQFFEETAGGGPAAAAAKRRSQEVRKVPLHF